MSNVTNYGFKCDQCEYVTQSEDDHIINGDGDYLCLKCSDAIKKLKKSHQEQITIKVATKLKIEEIHNLLCCAMEGGSNYWYYIEEYGNPDEIKCEYRHLDLPLSDNGYLMIRTRDDFEDEIEPVKLDRESIKIGLQIMADKYPHHWGNFVGDNYDAETGDVFLQCSLFGDIVYG